MGEGNHYKKYEKLGAHLRVSRRRERRTVCCVGPECSTCRRHRTTSIAGMAGGIPCVFAAARESGNYSFPGLGEGTLYKFEIKARHSNYLAAKADPYGFYLSSTPKTATVVHDQHRYEWHDQRWMEARPNRNWLEYAHCHLRSPFGFVDASARGEQSLPDLWRASRPPHSLCSGDGLHPH